MTMVSDAPAGTVTSLFTPGTLDTARQAPDGVR